METSSLLRCQPGEQITLNRGRDVARGRSRADALGAVDFQSHVFVSIDLCGDRGGGMPGVSERGRWTRAGYAASGGRHGHAPGFGS